MYSRCHLKSRESEERFLENEQSITNENRPAYCQPVGVARHDRTKPEVGSGFDDFVVDELLLYPLSAWVKCEVGCM